MIDEKILEVKYQSNLIYHKLKPSALWCSTFLD